MEEEKVNPDEAMFNRRAVLEGHVDKAKLAASIKQKQKATEENETIKKDDTLNVKTNETT